MKDQNKREKSGEIGNRENAKKSGNPMQPGNHSTSSRPIHRKLNRYEIIVNRIKRLCKRVKWKNVVIAALSILCVTLLLCQVLDNVGADAGEQTDEPELIFPSSDADADTGKRYELTDEERWVVASVVTAEAAGEPYMGKVAVAQCILQACEDDGIRPTEAVVKYRYAKSRPEPTEEALEAVEAVFDRGEVATSEPIKYFYAPALVYSEWHESQVYVMTIQGHKFFKEAE